MADLLTILSDHGIPHTTQHHHATSGHVQVHCPFCGDDNYHLGIRLDGQVAHCWRCGGHRGVAVLCKLLHKSSGEVKLLLGQIPASRLILDKRKARREAPKAISLPYGSRHLCHSHNHYLTDRGFDPEQLVHDYHLKATGPLGPYKWRIIVPIIRQEQLISYTGRDITDKSDTRYKNCLQEEEGYPAKSWLYDLDRCEGRNRVLVVEGPTDAWRMGIGSVATMGITWTWPQVELLSRFEMVFLLYDPEERAQLQAEKLMDELTTLGTEAEIVDCPAEDPGSLDEQQVKQIRRWLGL
jgi:DNA primase